MRHSQVFNTQFPRSMRCSPAEGTLAVAAEVSAAGAATVEDVGVEEATNEVAEASSPVRGVPGIRISRLESGPGAVTITGSGKRHTSVPNPPPVPGKISTLQDLQNEPVTSSARLNRQFKILYILTTKLTCRKYILCVKMKSKLSLKQVHFKLNGVVHLN